MTRLDPHSYCDSDQPRTRRLDLALDVCSRVVVLGGGRVLADGPAQEVLRDDALLASASLERPLRLQGAGA